MPLEKDATRRQFGRMAPAYAASPTHARGADLARLVELLSPRPEWLVLDVASGAGHTAVAVAQRVHHVMAVDLAPEMAREAAELAARKGIANLTARVMDVEALEFEDARFDAVTSRIAPHHFHNIAKALSEMARVTRPGGRLVLEDNCSPADPDLDSWLDRLERLRDPTHVRSYNEAEWTRMLDAAGFAIEGLEFYRRTEAVADWLDRAGMGAERQRAVEYLRSAPDSAREYFEIVLEGGDPVRISDDKILIVATRAGSK
jgi:ubiquinone/menaquinone biosynthesis C-methylase UbiE